MTIEQVNELTEWSQAVIALIGTWLFPTMLFVLMVLVIGGLIFGDRDRSDLP